MVLEKVSSAEQVADSLTKSTQRPVFAKHRDVMLGRMARKYEATRSSLCVMSERCSGPKERVNAMFGSLERATVEDDRGDKR
eukprot:3263600-Rhodomonas_salina.1